MRLILAILLLPILAHAQQTRTLSCRLLGFQTNEPVTSLSCVVGKSEVKCTFNTSGISSPVDLVAVDGELSFIDSKDRKNDFSVSVPTSVTQAIIVIMPNPKDPVKPWHGFAIDDSAKHFPNGGALVVNLHDTDIRFVIGEHKYMLKPGDQFGTPMPIKRDDFNMCTVAYAFSHKDQWAIVSESRLRFTEGLRYFVLVFTDPKSQRPTLSTYQDNPFKAAAAPTKP